MTAKTGLGARTDQVSSIFFATAEAASRVAGAGAGTAAIVSEALDSCSSSSGTYILTAFIQIMRHTSEFPRYLGLLQAPVRLLLFSCLSHPLDKIVLLFSSCGSLRSSINTLCSDWMLIRKSANFDVPFATSRASAGRMFMLVQSAPILMGPSPECS